MQEVATMSQTEMIRVESADVVETIALRNEVPFTRSSHAAAVTLADVTYYWTAA